jgi:hypothetical protein
MRVIVSFDADDSHADTADSTNITAWFHSNLLDALLRAPFGVDDIDVMAFPNGEQVSASELVEHFLTD